MAYPCGDCGKNCVKSVVACDSCDKWFHIRCQKLTKANLATLTDANSCEFHCFSCSYKNGEFDYKKSLDRLGKYATFLHTFLQFWIQI
jgi:hypothetical protein